VTPLVGRVHVTCADSEGEFFETAPGAPGGSMIGDGTVQQRRLKPAAWLAA
jgi:hypothetical protein